MTDVARKWIGRSCTLAIAMIFAANASLVFLHANSDPFVDAPPDQLRIGGQAVPAGQDPQVSVSTAWTRGWYPDGVAVLTINMAAFLLWGSRAARGPRD